MTKNKRIKFEVEFEYIGDRTQVKDWFKFAVETFSDQCHGDAIIENAKVKVVRKLKHVQTNSPDRDHGQQSELREQRGM